MKKLLSLVLFINAALLAVSMKEHPQGNLGFIMIIMITLGIFLGAGNIFGFLEQSSVEKDNKRAEE